MIKEPKVSVEKKVSKRPATRRKPLQTANSGSRKPVRAKSSTSKKQSQSVKLSDTAHYVLMAVGALIFVVGFYYFFIRPYSYRWKPCYGLKAYGVCLPYGYSVHGIDVSHHQDEIDWKVLKSVQYAQFPVRFVFIKATEGGDFKDKAFDYNFAEADSTHFIRGAYHFYNPNTDPIKQADFFIDNVKLKAGDLPPVLDIEKRPKDAVKLKRDLLVWLNRVERHYKVKPILYTSYKFKNKYLSDSVFNTYPYWIAHYYVDSVRYEGEWKFWQHTDVGTMPGINEQVDLNVFNGSMSDLLELTIKN
ncbi:glycoside hydrolase family 25 protein [Bacteroides caecigallinarum]|uniref:glycoside hydrolase family 25 protein n=1 Tax=Bacteroides caecigallinarum TaxID=1411144 RepID=UPI001F372265|nr:glycoside hydrolase family 25 protein [Bacteroides caecigallinarum]MCF2737014.1 glycoside hydrolase family 25 protein [Bacteroides caecigallinarum]